MYQIKIFDFHSQEYTKALNLRDRVLRQPLGLEFTTEELKKDEYDTHFGLFKDDIIQACLILTKNENGRMKMRQVAVDERLQGNGLGKELSLAAEKYAWQQGFNIMFCNARKTAVPFYQKLGYHVVGSEFIEVNIPHYLMEKDITHVASNLL